MSTADKGLTYRKIDLHIHTPASKCFRGGTTPEEIVAAALSKSLAGIAITDHNSAAWVDRVAEAARGTDLSVFPGVEVSCTGGKKSVHIIALFDVTKSSKHVEALLNVLGIGPDDYGNEDAVTDKGPVDVIKAIKDQGGLAVLAHANSSNGVLCDMSGQTRLNVIQCSDLLAVEATDFHDEQKRNEHKRTTDVLDGTDPNYKRKLAVYQASDNPADDGSGRHCLEGIGTRYSYFKIETVCLDALRQCLIDSPVRIRQEGEIQPTSHPRVSRVKINSGFLEGQEVHFHEGLTTILGAKGAGKSLLMEFMRFALNQEPSYPSLAQDHLSKLRTRLGEFGTVEVAFLDENGAESVVSRTFREIDGSPYDEDTPYDPAQVFPVLFLSQNEIINIAENESEQLRFIDQFFDFRAYRSKIAGLEHELERLDTRMAEGLRAYAEADEHTDRVSTIEKEITRLDKALMDPRFENFRQLQEKDRILSLQSDHFDNVVASVDRARDSILMKEAPSIPPMLEKDPAILRTGDAIRRARERLANLLAEMATDLKKERQSAAKEYDTWRPQFLVAKKDYEDYLQSVGGDYKALALRREGLVRELSAARRKLEVAGAKKTELTEVSKQRNAMLDELQTQYDAYTGERVAKCEKFQRDSAGKLKLQIKGSSNIEEFRSSLLALKRGSYLRDDEITQISSNVKPRDFVMSLLRYHALKESKHLKAVVDQSQIDIARMKTLADFLLNAVQFEDLLSLQYKAMPQDRPEILYAVGGGDYQPVAAVSVGQKCTAMLIMALSDGSMPVIIDQPEDSLDIRSIWEDMCCKLRTSKERRQFVFTTHNSSLAVASDSDCYLVLEGDANRGKLVHVGSMDHEPLVSEVLRYLEGGTDTYLLKNAKYKHGGVIPS